MRADKVLHAIAELRGGGGRLDDSRFHHRQRGQGPRWRMIEQLFAVHCRRLGLNKRRFAARATFRRPHEQGRLFGE
jgi:hypothetical protein